MNEPRPPRTLPRTIGALLAGLLVIVALSLSTDAAMHALKIYPPWGEPMSDPLFALATAYRIIYGVLGCYVAARLAPPGAARAMRLALVLGIVGVVLSLAGAVATWHIEPPLGPKWYAVAIVAISLPCAWVGGKLRVMQLRARGA